MGTKINKINAEFKNKGLQNEEKSNRLNTMLESARQARLEIQGNRSRLEETIELDEKRRLEVKASRADIDEQWKNGKISTKEKFEKLMIINAQSRGENIKINEKRVVESGEKLNGDIQKLGIKNDKSNEENQNLIKQNKKQEDSVNKKKSQSGNTVNLNQENTHIHKSSSQQQVETITHKEKGLSSHSQENNNINMEEWFNRLMKLGMEVKAEAQEMRREIKKCNEEIRFGWNKAVEIKDETVSRVQEKSRINCGDVVTLAINGKIFKVLNDVPPYTTLNTFIRDHAQLRGTKLMCNEGGCGSCVVSVKYRHPITNENVILSVNSCLVLVYACHGWSIRTIEGIGNKKDGYSKIQTTLAHFNGSQCGYCSPGFVMNMYSLREGNKNLTMEDVEKSFSGHICRCTGYRPILDAFKSLTSDANDQLKAKCADIEDLLQICPSSGTQCFGKCKVDEKEKANYDCVKSTKTTDDDRILEEFSSLPKSLRIESTDYSNSFWYKVKSVQESFEVLSMIPDDGNYMLVAGNTAQGAFRNEKEIRYYIDVKDVPELRIHSVKDDGIHIGANITLTEIINLFRATSVTSSESYSHLRDVADHIELVANLSVRNVGTVAGNLTLKRDHKDFPSDVFLTLETIGASLVIENGYGTSETIPVREYLETDMHKKLISNVIIPALSPELSYKSYKIMPRAQNAPAILNAGFLFNVDKSNKGRVESKPSIVVGGINPKFVHAENLESFLVGKELLNDSVLQEALSVFDSELKNNKDSGDDSFEYKRKLAEALFYRFVLSLNPDEVDPKYRSGANPLERGLSRGKQEYSTDITKWPVNKPIPKVEALAQCSGEAEYINDIPHYPHELQGALVVTTISRAKIASIDPNPALKMPGVVAFFSAKDIPGENTFLGRGLLYPEKEILFCDGHVLYTGQPVGIIVAETREIALKAAKRVKISYTNIVPPRLHVKGIISAGEDFLMKLTGSFKPELPLPKVDVKFALKGTLESPSQYHFTMEVQSCLCVPKEGELYVYPSTQWTTSVQEGISLALNIHESKINVSTKRVGGAYGSKISRASIIATSSAIAAYLTQRPVRLILDLETNTAAIGKRNTCFVEYEAGISGSGKILLLNLTLYEDNGIYYNEPSMPLILDGLSNIYDRTTWVFKGLDVKTDKASCVWARAPGTIEAAFTIESIIEHVASVLKKDPLEVRLANADPSKKTVLDMIKQIVKSSDLKKRKEAINSFNKKNRWRKKGISVVPMRFTFISLGPYHALVAVYAQDGSVTVCHGGIEMGQGMNTKVSQVVAAKLGVDLDKVSVKATNSITSPNNALSGASLTTENVCKAAELACNKLLGKLQPIKVQLGPGSTWFDIIKKAYASSVDLLAVAQVTELGGLRFSYDCYGVAVSEVEVDLLTGNHVVIRTDILEDAGQSLSPEIDVGQVEGAFVMGLGLFTSEELKYNEKTGVLKTNRTWNYHPPGARDIPCDLRVKLLKNSTNPEGVRGSKATGEPPLLLSTSILFAIRDAVRRAREDAGDKEDWFEFKPPYTTERILLTSLTSREHFKLYS